MSDEQDKLKLSLEPPKLFGRKKKSDATGTSNRTSSTPAAKSPPASGSSAPADDASETAPAEEPTEETVEEAVEATVTEELETAPEPMTEPEPEPEPVAEAVPVQDPEPEPIPEPAPKPHPAPEKAAAPPRPAPAKKPAAKSTRKPADKPADKPAAAARTAVAKTTEPAKKATSRPRAKLAPDIEPEPVTSIELEDAEIAARSDEPPLLPLYPAAAVTGVVVGAAMILLIWLSLRGCEAVRGSANCSGGSGFMLLVATFVLCVLLGSTLLKVFSIPDPGSGSFLAVGLIAVVALLFLIDVLDHWSMIIVIPIISVGAYLTSVWVTKTFVEPGEA